MKLHEKIIVCIVATIVVFAAGFFTRLGFDKKQIDAIKNELSKSKGYVEQLTGSFERIKDTARSIEQGAGDIATAIGTIEGGLGDVSSGLEGSIETLGRITDISKHLDATIKLSQYYYNGLEQIIESIIEENKKLEQWTNDRNTNSSGS